MRVTHNLKDVSGQRFGLLTVIARCQSRCSQATWLCRCDCGAEVEVVGARLRNGNTKSCGCLRGQVLLARNVTHGMSGSPEYIIWRAMIQRCTDRNQKASAYYVERGITVCDRWLHSFETFLADMGPRPSARHSLDRVQNALGYSKENCRWATATEQGRNKRNNHMVTFRDETRCLVEWSEITGLPYDVIKSRLRMGWPAERALTQAPLKKPGSGPRRKAA